MQQEEKYIYMTETPVPRLIGELAVPTIISMLVTSFYNMADTFFVGKLNTQSTAAVGIVFSVMAIIQALGFFFGHGSGNYISRRLGAKDFEEAAVMAANGFFLAFLCGIAVLCGGLIFLKPLAIALGSTPTILPYTEAYLRIILIGAPFMTSSLVLNNQLRFQGSAAYAMVGIVTGAVINIVLDPLLIFVCGMGVAGAAAATVISQFCSFLLLLYQSRKGGNIDIKFRSGPMPVLASAHCPNESTDCRVRRGTGDWWAVGAAPGVPKSKKVGTHKMPVGRRSIRRTKSTHYRKHTRSVPKGKQNKDFRRDP